MLSNEHGETIVKCPVCDIKETHHGEVISYVRAGGEDSTTIEKRVDYKSEYVSTRNPSPRRNAVGINFSCESGHHFNMNVLQHKGTTYIEFEEVKLPF